VSWLSAIREFVDGDNRQEEGRVEAECNPELQALREQAIWSGPDWLRKGD
jgi:hypothetical protein